MREVAMAPIRELMANYSEQEMYNSSGEAYPQTETPCAGAGSGKQSSDSMPQQVRPLQLSDLLEAFQKVAPAGQDGEDS
jgi:hypothetical protein